MQEISVKELKEALDGHQDWTVLCVREDYERDICKLPGDTHIPLAEIKDRCQELNKDKTTVVYCRSGNRSRYAADYLERNGFKDVRNLTGGILAWAEEIDSNVQTY